MTSINNFELPYFKQQLSNAMANVFNPDPQLKTLIGNFLNLQNPTSDDFNNLSSSVSSYLENSSSKTKAAFSPVMTLFMVKQLHTQLEDFKSEPSSTASTNSEQVSFPTSSHAIMKCVGKPGSFALELITNTPTNLDEFFSARAACKSFSATRGDHWLTFTGEVDGCKGPYKSSEAFYACEMEI